MRRGASVLLLFTLLGSGGAAGDALAQAPPPATSTVAPVDPTAPNTRPFGAGAPVSIGCDRAHAYAFVAKGALDARPSYPDPFVKVGRLPLTIELPPGVYTLIAEGDTLTTGSTVFEVRQAPTRITIKGGSSGLRELSTWMLALGAVAVLAGGVLELSGTAGETTREKHAIALPLFIGGGVALGGGLAMVLASGTRFQTDAFVPGASGPAARPSTGLTLSGQF